MCPKLGLPYFPNTAAPDVAAASACNPQSPLFGAKLVAAMTTAALLWSVALSSAALLLVLDSRTLDPSVLGHVASASAFSLLEMVMFAAVGVSVAATVRSKLLSVLAVVGWLALLEPALAAVFRTPAGKPAWLAANAARELTLVPRPTPLEALQC